MAKQKTIQTNTDKILNSDIYDLTAFVDSIKKTHIDVEDKETLLVGMYGYLGYEFASLLQNSIVVSSELANEAIPTRAKFDRNVITHALSLGIRKIAASPANMKVLLCFPEKALRNNMIDDRFILKASTPIYFDELEFHLDYDIQIDLVRLTDSTNGTNMDYVYTARYLIDESKPNPISDITNVYLPPLSIFKDVSDNMVVLSTNIHQVQRVVSEHKIVSNDKIVNKTINFTFTDQLSHFTVEVQNSNGEVIKELVPVYDGLYDQSTKDYCYYQYINSNTIRLRFTPDSYVPETNCNVVVNIYTSKGEQGNFSYSEDLLVRLTSDEYTNLYMIVKQRGTDGAYGGLDRKSVEELQKIIPREALSRGSNTTATDLKNYFNSINNENSVLHVFKKEDNILTRTYYTYCLMKDSNYNVIPTNTIPVYVEELESSNGKMYIESGAPIYYYKYGDGPNLNLLRNNFIGYMQENVVLTQTEYSYNNPTYNFFNGTPTQLSLIKNDIVYEVEPNPHAYKFTKGASIYFKLNPAFDGITPESEEYQYYDEWYHGIVEDISLSTKLPRKDIDGNTIPVYDEDGNDVGIEYDYYFTVSIRFYDAHKYFSSRFGGHNTNEYAYCSTVHVPGYMVDMSRMSQDEKLDYVKTRYIDNTIINNSQTLLLEDIMAVGDYSYNSQNPNYSYDSLSLDVGDNIRFCTHGTETGSYEYLNVNTWKLGEVISIKYRSNRIVGLEVLVHNPETNDFTAQSFRLPVAEIDDSVSLGTSLNSSDIIRLYKITKFLYTTPMSIVLSDNSGIDSHRISASYYLDTIKENRYLDFKCINSNSTIQFITSHVNVTRPSYLSNNRYRYVIRVEVTPNVGTINDSMINRTQLIATFYQDGNNPIIYSTGKYVGINNDTNAIVFEFYLYTRPFAPKLDSNGPETVDDNHRLYIGDEILVNDESIDDEAYLDMYRIYSTAYSNSYDNDTSIGDPVRPLEPGDNFSKDNPGIPFLKSLYLPFNLKMRIYTLYKYDTSSESERSRYEDSLTRDYMYNNDNYLNEIPLTSLVNRKIEFTMNNPVDKETMGYMDNYTLDEMVLTNVYDTHDGINLLYDYSNLMNSYVTMLRSNTLFDNSDINSMCNSYIVNRVPCIRYFYFSNENRINTFIAEMKRKITYVLDALDPLETTFGIDFKFFNTYGPSNMYHITHGADGAVSDLIDNVALNLTFRAKFYNENSDKDSIIPLIKDDIKNYIENLEDLSDIHFPNLVTEIETKYQEYLIYFEYVEFNVYDANHQHIITNENMEMLTVVPEFLNVDTDDYTGLPRIEIRVVT